MGASGVGDRRVILLAVVPLVLWTALLLSLDQTFWSLVYDDSFYYWQIGSNLAGGLGSTFDGFHQTNGYHPLWLLFCAGLFAIGLGRDVVPLATVLVQVALFAAAWLLLGRSALRLADEVPARRPAQLRTGVLACLLAIACSQPMLKVWVNGLESTFVLLCQTGLLAVLLSSDDLLARPARRRRWLFAGLLALAFVSRTDAGLLLVSVAIWLLPGLIRRFAETVGPALEMLALPGTVALGYLIANQVWFGSAIQVSGLLKTPDPSLWRVVAALLVLAIPILAVGRLTLDQWPRLSLVLARTRPIGLFALLLVAYYGALQEFPRVWYFGPVLLYAVVLGCAALADLLDLAGADADGRLPTRLVATLLVAAALPIVLGLWLAVSAPSAASMLTGRTAARYLASELPPDAVLASWDAGVLGYYSRRPVVNLDGVVNSAGYLAALRSGTTADYLAGVPIGWVVNHAPDEASLRDAAQATLGDRAASARVVRSWPFEVVGGSNQALPSTQRMQVFLLKLG